MTKIDAMAKTYREALFRVPCPAVNDLERDAMRAVLREHVQPLIAEAYWCGVVDAQDGQLDSRLFIRGNDDKAYAARIVRSLSGEADR